MDERGWNMHVQERRAWFVLGVIAAALILFAVTACAVGLRSHSAAYGSFGLFGLAGFAPLIGRRDEKRRGFTMDERDQQIERTASLAGWAVFQVLFVAAAMAPFFALGPHAVVRVSAGDLAMLPISGMGVFMLVRSLVTVVLYRREDHA